jgi:hypothetical protein
MTPGETPGETRVGTGNAVAPASARPEGRTASARADPQRPAGRTAAPPAAAGLLPAAASRLVSERPLEGFAGRAYTPPGFWLSRDDGTVTPWPCPAKAFDFEAVYPQGLDAGGPVDRAVEAVASMLMADARDKGGGMARTGRLCGLPGPSRIMYTGFPYRSSPVYGPVTGILFVSESYDGGSGGSMWYYSMNLLPDGSELSPPELFPGNEKGLSVLWTRMHRGFCSAARARGHKTGPALFGSPSCSVDAPPPKGWPPPGALTLDALGHALVTSLGLTVPLDPSEAWGWPGGPSWLDIPKGELVAMGADPAIWSVRTGKRPRPVPGAWRGGPAAPGPGSPAAADGAGR